MNVRNFSKLFKRLLVSGAGRRKSIMLQKASANGMAKQVASRGHFIVYTIDQKRYMVPITYLENETFRGLLERSEEEFGNPGSRPIILPCDAYFMEHLMLLIERTVTELEKAILLCN